MLYVGCAFVIIGILGLIKNFQQSLDEKASTSLGPYFIFSAIGGIIVGFVLIILELMNK